MSVGLRPVLKRLPTRIRLVLGTSANGLKRLRFIKVSVIDGLVIAEPPGWEVVMFSKAWKQWVSLNGNNLAWIALTVGGVLFTSLLVKI